MSVVTRGLDKPIRDVDNFVSDMTDRGADDIGYELKTSVIRATVREGAIDTTAMIQAFDYHRSPVTDSGVSIRVDTSNNPDVFYDGFVEFETENRDGSMRRGRYVYKQGIETANMEQVFDGVARRSFVV